MDTLGEGYDYVNMVLNKGQKSGFISVPDFNAAMRAAHRELFTDARSHYEKTSTLSDDARAVIATKGDAGDANPLMSDATGLIDFPSDYKYYASMSWKKVVNAPGCNPVITYKAVEKLTEASWNTRITSELKGPEDNYPICCVRNNKIQVAPAVNNRRYSLTYWKDVAEPNFDYILVEGAVTYLAPGEVHDGTNPDPALVSGTASGSVEFVWPEPSRFWNKVLRILSANKRSETAYQEGAVELGKQEKQWS